MNEMLATRCFAHGLADFGDRPALRTETETVTYTDLANRVDEFGARLGCDRSLLMIETGLSVESVTAYLAALRYGHPVILANPETPETNAEIVEIFDVGAVVDALGAVRMTEAHPTQSHLHPDLALLLSTSGSTGSAKLVRLSYRNIQSNAESIAAYLHLTPRDVGAATLPLHYSFGLSILNSHLCVGASLYLHDRPLTDPTFLDDIHRAGCTSLSGVPYSYEIFERSGFRERPLNRLRFMTVAGGRLPPERVRLYARHCRQGSAEFFVMYGQTEAAPRIAYLPPEAADEHPDCIGIAIPGGELSLCDEEGRPVTAARTPGELVYRGPNVMMGYAEAAVDLEKGREVEALHTGDLGEWTEAGFIRIVGRKSRFSKLAGLRISHDEVERRLSLAGVACAVTGDDERLVVAVETDREPEDFLKKVMSITGLNAGRIAILPCEEIPRLPTGKPDYRTIRGLLAEAARETPSASVHAAFSKAFWPRGVAAEDSFVSLAGDSLTFVTLTIDLEDLFGVLPEGWEETPITELEARLRSSASSRSDEDARPGGPVTDQRRPWSRVDVNTYVRVIAISSVLVHHLTPVRIKDGALVLVAMLGYTLARFQSASLFSGRTRGILGQVTKNILIYYVILVLWMLLEGEFRIPELLLMSNIIADAHEPIAYNIYWFVEAYAVITLLICLLFSIRGLRAVVSRHPLASGLVAVLLGAGALHLGRSTWLQPWNACYYGACNPFTEVVSMYAIGWCLYFARSSLARLSVLALCITTFVLADEITKRNTLFCIALLSLLAWRINIPAPRPISSILATIAANSYVIYLVHIIPFYFLFDDVNQAIESRPLRAVVNLALGIGASMLAAALLHRLEAWARHTWSRAAA